MKYAVLCLLCAITGCRNPAVGNAAEPHPDTSGWEALFAPDLSNADYDAGVWTTSGGVLTASEDKVVWTRRDYNNFILDLECKNGTNANSGVVVYCSDTKNWIPNSLEIQILDDFGNKWTKVDDTWRSGAIFGRLAPTQRMINRPGEWNRYTITCIDTKIDVVINGELVTSMDMTQWTDAAINPDGSKIPNWLAKNPVAGMPTHGRVGLQGKHGGAPIWFRNIRIRELN
ncbi:MAG: DUF1080 domain-containing protein [Kiritimatiellales bacterium]|nr:DUF1080 domain-containing protein [Kiritimatiellales bacterium]